MSKALIAGINQVATDKGLDREVIFEAIEAALVSAYKRNFGSIANISAEVDRGSGEMKLFAEREVVDDVMNPRTEIEHEEALKLEPDVQMGDVISVQSAPESFGRIAAQTAKQVILQRIREAERDTVYENFAHRLGEILTAQVRNVDELSGAVTVLLDDKTECLMMREDRIPNERLRRGDYIKVYVADVKKSTRGPVIKISRTHRNLLRRLMEQEIPEVKDGTVEIKAVAREPGARSKAAVVATRPGVDPVGSCVGPRGMRIQNIVNELVGEKIDVVEWSTNLYQYIANALSPAKVESVLLDENNSIKTATVIVPDRQLSLAIGKAGQNARLAAKLTGWRIDIKSESEAIAEGLDAKIAEQAERMATSHDDLLSMAERLLQQESSSTMDDALTRAAEAIQEMPSTLTPESMEMFGGELPPLGAPPADARQSRGGELPDLSEFLVPEEEKPAPVEWPSLDEIDEMPAMIEEDFEEFAEPEPEDELEGMQLVNDLPEIITADMLRSRTKDRGRSVTPKKDFDDIEVPAELLAGLNAEELSDYQGEQQDEQDDEEEETLSRKERKKAKGKRNKSR